MGRVFKTPSRRRQKKWRTRVEKLAYSDIGRRGFSHWFSELLRCQPLIEAAKRAGVDLIDNIPVPPPTSAEQTRQMLYQVILGQHHVEDWPTRENLEI